MTAPNRSVLPPLHLLLALTVMAVWGTNFVVIRWGLNGLPPFLFATLRFTFSALPWLLFVPRPTAPWRKMAAFGVLLGVGQFGLLFLAMRSSISPGLASLVVQLQVFFTIGLSLWLMGERVRGFQIAGLLLALCGLGVIAANKFWEVQKNVALTNHQYNPQSVIFSKKVWDTMSAAEKKIIDESADEAVKAQREANRAALNNNLELLKKNGMNVTTLPAAEIAKLREKMKPVIDKHSAALGTVVADVQAELAKMRK